MAGLPAELGILEERITKATTMGYLSITQTVCKTNWRPFLLAATFVVLIADSLKA
jgi:hypothetical protein